MSEDRFNHPPVTGIASDEEPVEVLTDDDELEDEDDEDSETSTR